MHSLPYPTTVLHALWPWPDGPVLEVMRAQLDGRGRIEPDEHEWHQAHGGVLVLLPHDAAPPVRIWIESLAPDTGGVRHPDLSAASGLERRRFATSRWKVVLQQLLDARDAPASFHQLLQVAVLVCPDVPALYDEEALRLHPGAAVRRMAAKRVPPPPHTLFRTHAVLGDHVRTRRDAERAPTWVHTHGLARAGLPDLELQRVPGPLVPSAAELLLAIAACGMEAPAFIEGPASFEIVSGFPLRLRTLEQLGSACEPARDGEERGRGHGGNRAAVVRADRPTRPPVACLEAIAGGAALASMGRRETERMQRRARDAWPELGMAFVRHRRDPAYTFLVQLGCPVDRGAPDQLEHLWFEVLEIAPGRVRGRLRDAPVAIERMQAGEEGWHDLTRLTDWAIHGPSRTVRPHDV